MAKRKPDLTPDFWGMARSFLHVYMAKARACSPKTVDAYREALECYLDFLAEHEGVARDEVGFDHFERGYYKTWVEWMRASRAYAPKTIGLRMTGVRSFLCWCGNEDIALMALYDGVKAIRPPKAPKRPVDYLDDGELAAVLAANRGDGEKSRRNRMMLVMLYESAARVSELTGITVGDLSLSAPARVMLHGKGNKSRVVPIGDKCASHLREYMGEFHPGRRPDPGRPLFYSNRGGVPAALSTDTVSRILKEAGDMARADVPTVPEGLHCHLIRRTRAMGLYRAGVPLPLIMQLLGHESMSTTSSFYAFATQEMMAKAIADAAPKVVSVDDGWLTEERKRALYSLR